MAATLEHAYRYVLHAETVRATLDLVLDLDTPPRDLHTLLTLFNELSEDAGAKVAHGPTRASLSTLSGSSKAAKAAKALLAREGPTRHPTAALALEARISRAERWTASIPR